MNLYTVKMSSVGNPDFGEDPKKSKSPKINMPCNSLKECSRHCLKYIGMFDLGGGNWNGGQVFQDGIQIARISYNGRIWDMDDKEIKASS